MKSIIRNGKIITNEGILPDGSVVIEDGVISHVGNWVGEIPGYDTIDATGCYVAPGFIDLHVHGGGGHDFMDGTVEAFEQVLHTHLLHGTTSMMPTTLTSTPAALTRVLDTYEKIAGTNDTGVGLLGLHIEGPYFAMNHRGAQDPRFIRAPDPDEYISLLNRYTCISRWSVAPELEGALNMGLYLREKCIIASIAHTDAVYEDIRLAVQHGFTLVTHLYSGMNGVIRRGAYRFAGTVESAFLMDCLDVEIIADGKHLPVPLLQLIYKIKGPDRIALVTDAMRAAGTTHTESILGNLENGLPVIIEEQVAMLPDKTSFAGSIATADRLVRVMWKEAGIPLSDVIKMMCHTPAKIAGVSKHKGELSTGMDADIVIFDESVQIQQVFIGGTRKI
ncbi:N-acetylglucosamine-6-phosphate deacetylase [Flavihumibacter sp. RY-1]|uniref:N-acetylglucosamine-6-phosphate deacetylase n=1 Tax=Flavihumibacter fluminis TaxID=2909236 RepID=A0ABS9BJY6_9BACT|nr:N-acetylglucosamine-6-phosphate deacetylase [Flavihumibacter fluminis]MCF1715645.1 N-acetylglucosamine-6-phosphate deacetylase [Flavihumibacter fluminis]